MSTTYTRKRRLVLDAIARREPPPYSAAVTGSLRALGLVDFVPARRVNGEWTRANGVSWMLTRSGVRALKEWKPAR